MNSGIHQQIQIVEVTSKKLHRDFIQCSWNVLSHDPHWVPPLRLSLEDILRPSHPFYQTSHMKRWIALRQGQVVGRIAAIVNEAHQQVHHEKCGMFGFFECIDDVKVAQALFTKAAQYLMDEGMTHMRGPFSPSMNYECGLLVQGFDDPPQIMMTYNPPYYIHLLESMGLRKCKDLLAFRLPTDSVIPDKILRISDRVAKANQVTWRPLRKSNWAQEMKLMEEIYNDAWEHNWGHIPMSSAEFSHLAKNLKSVCNEELTLFVEVRGRPAGFIVALPDFNQLLQKIPNGKLLPFGIFKVLFGGKSISRARIITLGIRREFRPLGLSTLLYTQIQQQFFKLKQYTDVEMSWILEDNEHMVKPLRVMGAHLYKTYRLYEKPL